LDTFIRENAIEWHASWFIGKASDIGFRGVLPGGSRIEVQRSLAEIRRSEASSRIVVDYGRLERIAETLHRRRARVVFTNGVFDLLHVGHLGLLEKARALGDALIVAINSDDSTRRIKGTGRPIIPQFARARVLASLRYVDACFIFPEERPVKALQAVRPNILVKGSEYPIRRIVGARFVSGYGGKVVRLPMVEGHSTTSTIRSIQRA
jgi:D-beta-D-heptose 7-phosphate kinase/D-beta-D-heptose 1-phosphate adenosyltransferase